MKKTLFCDLDNTIIFSHKYDIGERVLVEKLNGRDQAYMTKLGYDRLQTFPRDRFIPITSRTISQYERISFYRDGGCPRYALVDNGGILLVDGACDAEWLGETNTLIKNDIPKLDMLAEKIANSAEIKWQDDMFLFIKTSNKDEIKNYAEGLGLFSFDHGSKLYVCSGKLTKGRAISRFKERLYMEHIVVAGDSVIDISMAEEADEACFSETLEKFSDKRDGVYYVKATNIAEILFQTGQGNNETMSVTAYST